MKVQTIQSHSLLTKPERFEIRLAGRGGQGLIKMGLILAEAAAREGKRVVQLQRYGSEPRGGLSRSDVIIGDVDYPGVLKLDVLLSLDQQAYDENLPLLKPGGLVIFDSDLVKPRLLAGIQHSIPFTQIAEELGDRTCANSVALGYLVAVTGIVEKETVEEVLAESMAGKFPWEVVETNLKAFNRGYAEGYARNHDRATVMQKVQYMC
jgi:2-oxoglutarate ferredoxin oxidoreductase subunit gamma